MHLSLLTFTHILPAVCASHCADEEGQLQQSEDTAILMTPVEELEEEDMFAI